MRENPTRQMRQNLAVGERAIDTRTHGAEITLANLGMDRRASEFEIGQRNAVRRRREGHFAEELGADLVAEAARPAMDADDDVAARQAEHRGDCMVGNRRHLLYFEIVVARAQRAHLLTLAVPRAMRHRLGLGAQNTATLLDPVEILDTAVAL